VTVLALLLLQAKDGEGTNEESIRRLITLLTADDASVRERAQSELIGKGSHAIRPVSELVSSQDRDIAARARMILQEIGSRLLLRLQESVKNTKGLSIQIELAYETQTGADAKQKFEAQVSASVKIADNNRFTLRTTDSKNLHKLDESCIISDVKSLFVRTQGGL